MLFEIISVMERWGFKELKRLQEIQAIFVEEVYIFWYMLPTETEKQCWIVL